MSSFLLLWACVSVSCVCSVDPRVDPLVRIEQGLIRGQKSSDGSYSTFLGIPYATVNLDNPFGVSDPAPQFDYIFEANDDSIQCPQSFDHSAKTKDNGSETLDCLRLNIYVPSKAGSKNPLPVLVWIHGGGFSSGSAMKYRPKNLLKHDIIVVTINYRLGPYGFLCLDTPLVPGNQGFKDQYEALAWVRNNILAFGGNPYKVTIAGQGAGSISALLQLYSSRPKLFDKVIAQSGTPKAYVLEKNSKTAIKLANYLNYNTTNTEEAINFLAKIPIEIVTGAVTATKLLLGPCTEKSYSGIVNFLDSTPYMATNEKNVKKTPILIGHTLKEIPVVNQYELDSNSTDPFLYTLKRHFNFADNESVEEIAGNVRNFYIGDGGVNNNVADEIGNFKSDFWFNHPTQRMIDSLLKENSGAIYEYVFTYVSNKTIKGAEHSAEMPYLFDGSVTFSQDDLASSLVSQQITTLWANFVKYGNPTPSKTGQDLVKWPPVTSKSRSFMVIDAELQVVNNRIFHKRMAFWNLFFSAYGKRHKMYRDCI